MKTTMLSLLALILLGICGFQNNVAKAGEFMGTTIAAKPSVYFPQKIGSKWEYKITLGKAEAQSVIQTDWRISKNKVMTTEMRRRYLPKPGKLSYNLVLKVIGKAKTQGYLSYKDSVELKIEKDDLGFFPYIDKLFFASGKAGLISYILLVQQLSPNSPGAPTGSYGMPVALDGTSMRCFFFQDKVGNGLAVNNSEVLVYLGKDNGMMHFLRKVSASDDYKKEKVHKTSIGCAFTEDYWFSRDIGLTKMVQKVGGNISMTWELTKYTKK